MESTDRNGIEHRARVAYEWGRLRRALVGFAPVLLLAAVVAWLGGTPLASAPFVAALFVAGVIALWYGREPKRAVLPGVVAGLIPVVLTTSAMHMGRMCFGDRCTSVCLAACIVGGVGAGMFVGLAGVRGHRGLPFWVAASVIAMATGAMTCSCLGYAGFAGLAAGYGMGALSALAPRFIRRRIT